MSEQGKAQIQTLGAGLIGFLGVVAAGAFLVLPRDGGVKAASSAAAFDAKAPLALSAPAPSARPSAGAPAGGAASAASSPAPLLPTDAPEPVVASAPGAAPAAHAGSSRAPRLAPTAHLDLSGSARSSAVASASASKPGAKPAAERKPFAAPKLDLSRSIGIASTVHYGVSSRAELMGRAAGPVYNFSGRGLKAPATGSSISGQATTQVDQARAQIDSSNLSDGDKAKIDQGLDQAKSGVQKAADQTGQ